MPTSIRRSDDKIDERIAKLSAALGNKNTRKTPSIHDSGKSAAYHQEDIKYLPTLSNNSIFLSDLTKIPVENVGKTVSASNKTSELEKRAIRRRIIAQMNEDKDDKKEKWDEYEDEDEGHREPVRRQPKRVKKEKTALDENEDDEFDDLDDDYGREQIPGSEKPKRKKKKVRVPPKNPSNPRKPSWLKDPRFKEAQDDEDYDDDYYGVEPIKGPKRDLLEKDQQPRRVKKIRMRNPVDEDPVDDGVLSSAGNSMTKKASDEVVSSINALIPEKPNQEMNKTSKDLVSMLVKSLNIDDGNKTWLDAQVQ